MTCPTVKKLGTLAIEKLDVLNAINAHLIDVFQGAAFCRYLKPDLIMVIQKKIYPRKQVTLLMKPRLFWVHWLKTGSQA